MILRTDDPLAVAAVEAIRQGDVEALTRLLRDNEGLATARLRKSDDDCNDHVERTLLHVATDFPGQWPNVASTVPALVAAGADVDARNTPGTETPLHWAASSDDVEAIDALVAAGADIEASGAVIAGGTPVDDAVAFGQWKAARRLVEHGAHTALWHASALGLVDRLSAHYAGDRLPGPYPWGAGATPPPDELTVAFWCACHGGQLAAAEYLRGQGADINWVSGWDGLTPLDAARREGFYGVADWLRAQGGRSAQESA